MLKGKVLIVSYLSYLTKHIQVNSLKHACSILNITMFLERQDLYDEVTFSYTNKTIKLMVIFIPIIKLSKICIYTLSYHPFHMINIVESSVCLCFHIKCHEWLLVLSMKSNNKIKLLKPRQ